MKQYRPLSAFFLSLTAAIMWGALPIALQPTLKVMNAQTVVCFRFFTAMLGMFLILFFAKKLPKRTAFNRKNIKLILLGIAGLSCNFFLFNLSLKYIPPTASQVLSPLSSFAMLLAGIFVFKERMGLHQKIGLVLLITGLLLFFSPRFADFLQMNQFALGIICASLASLIWVSYGIAQKLLLAQFNALQILLVIYFGCTWVFLPLVDLPDVEKLSPFIIGCLIFCCINTVLAYGCYAEALNRWEVSKVSVMMTQIPIMTIILSQALYLLFPHYFNAPDLPLISLIGAILVVLGAMFAAIGHKLIYRNQLRK